MPRIRVQPTAAEEAIINKGGEPGSGSSAAVAAPPKAVRIPASRTTEASGTTGTAGAYRTAVIRFNPNDFDAVKQAVSDYGEKHRMKVSMTAWIVSACLEKIERDK